MLNYLYSLLEAEARLAAAALGLDPGLGFLHVDTPARDSLACDLMEPVRPQHVDAFVLDWITRSPLKREWFFEQRNGNCRLMGEFTATLSETAPMWRHAVAPIAEWVARELWSTMSKPARELAPATRLTQRRKREAKGAPSLPPRERAPRQENICRGCGGSITSGSTHCVDCAVAVSTEHLVNAAQSGRVASHTPEAQARRADTQSRHHAARRNWVASSQPAWLDQEAYDRKIQPLLRELSNSALALALDVSIAYAADIRAGRRRPHPRHWQALAQLVGVSADEQ
jgi:hypothetical protein